jgi:uncharacterized protein YegL
MERTTTTIPRRPGGAIASRPLDFIWLCDTSGSMAGMKIESLNFAIADALPAMRDAAADYPQAKIFVRAVQFDNDARWVVGERTPVEEFRWQPLRVTERGLTEMGAALALVAHELRSPPFPEAYWPPVLVLVTDGYPTDDTPGLPTFEDGLRAVMAEPAGRAAIRLGIAIGDEAKHETLARFIDNPKVPVLQARTAGELVNYIKVVSTASIGRSTAPAVDGETTSFTPGPIQLDATTGPPSWTEPLH